MRAIFRNANKILLIVTAAIIAFYFLVMGVSFIIEKVNEHRATNPNDIEQSAISIIVDSEGTCL